MRRRQAYAQPDERIGFIEVVRFIESPKPPTCVCGKTFDSEHGLKIHKARQKH